MKHLKKRVENFKDDYVQWMSCIAILVLLASHVYQFVNSGYRIEPLIRVVYCAIYPVAVLLFGRKAIAFLALILALVIEQFASFTNYTAFFIVLMYIFVYKKMKIPVLLLYVLDVIIVCQHHEKTAVHLLIHFSVCAFMYMAMKIIVKDLHVSFKNLDKLKLDDSERFILQRLADGSKQKEIDEYSENTVSKKLKKCREKNDCSTNSELLQRFIAEKLQNCNE